MNASRGGAISSRLGSPPKSLLCIQPNSDIRALFRKDCSEMCFKGKMMGHVLKTYSFADWDFVVVSGGFKKYGALKMKRNGLRTESQMKEMNSLLITLVSPRYWKQGCCRG